LPSILKHPIGVNNAMNWVDRFNGGNSPNDGHLYVGIGRESSWTVDTNPPTPADTVNAMEDFWDNMIGAQKVNLSDIVLAVPRRDWTAGTEYFEFDKNSSTAYDSKFYVVNSEKQVFKVHSKDSGNPTASNEPLFDSGVSTDPIKNTGDGYEWEFLYDISTSNWANIVTDDWLVVNWDHNLSSDQQNYGDVDAAYTLGARYAIIRILLTDDKLPVNVEYRQIGLLVDPKENISGEPIFTDPYGLMSSYNSPATDDFVNYSGNLVYLENRKPIRRDSGQSETIKLLLKF